MTNLCKYFDWSQLFFEINQKRALVHIYQVFKNLINLNIKFNLFHDFILIYISPLLLLKYLTIKYYFENIFLVPHIIIGIINKLSLKNFYLLLSNFCHFMILFLDLLNFSSSFF